jgi:nucleotide-binding universal stress UspA family protein
VGGWKRIGCAVDFSEGSRPALREAIDLARRSEGSLVLLHAEEVPGVTDIPPPQGVVDALAREDRETLDAWAREAAASLGRPVEARLLPGPAAPAMARAAADLHLDLLVTGTHGRRGFRHLVLGSVAERVVHLAPCAVLVVRA